MTRSTLFLKVDQLSRAVDQVVARSKSSDLMRNRAFAQLVQRQSGAIDRLRAAWKRSPTWLALPWSVHNEACRAADRAIIESLKGLKP